MTVWYNPKRDGTIEEYIKYCRIEMLPKCFKGYGQFKDLKDKGYITPNITNLRLMYNYARDDEFYGVIDGYRLEGIILNSHSGKEGIHDPKDILEDAPYFEIDMINPNPKKL